MFNRKTLYWGLQLSTFIPQWNSVLLLVCLSVCLSLFVCLSVCRWVPFTVFFLTWRLSLGWAFGNSVGFGIGLGREPKEICEINEADFQFCYHWECKGGEAKEREGREGRGCTNISFWQCSGTPSPPTPNPGFPKSTSHQMKKHQTMSANIGN